MRNLLVIGIALTLTSGCGAATQEIEIPVDPAASIIITEDLSVRHVQEGAFVFSHAFPWPANSLAVVSGNDLLLVDTPYTPDATANVLEWLEEEVGAKDIVAVNAHWHLDNLGGNEYLVEQGIPVYGSDRAVELLAERGSASQQQVLSWLQDPENERYRTLGDVTVTPPTETFPLEQGLRLEIGDETVEVGWPGPGHTDDNLVVYFPDRRLLFGGCLVIGEDRVGNTADADVEHWADSLGNIEQYEFDMVVPGHGDRLDPGLIEHTITLLGEA